MIQESVAGLLKNSPGGHENPVAARVLTQLLLAISSVKFTLQYGKTEAA
jgi:hypothetical protein